MRVKSEMVPVTTMVKKDVYICDYTGVKFESYEDCINSEKDFKMKSIVSRLYQLSFFANYQIAPVKDCSGVVRDNLNTDRLVFMSDLATPEGLKGNESEHRGFYLCEHIVVKVCIKGNSMILLLRDYKPDNSYTEKFLGDVDLRRVQTWDQVVHYNQIRNARLD